MNMTVREVWKCKPGGGLTVIFKIKTSLSLTRYDLILLIFVASLFRGRNISYSEDLIFDLSNEFLSETGLLYLYNKIIMGYRPGCNQFVSNERPSKDTSGPRFARPVGRVAC